MAQQNKNKPREGFGTEEMITKFEERGATIYGDIEGVRARIIESLRDAGEKAWNTAFANGKTFSSCFSGGDETLRVQYPKWNAAKCSDCRRLYAEA